MDKLLSLKWNNHKISFLETLIHLREKDTYTDVTLACEGKLYNAHKLVLSTCSDYFCTIFQSIQSKKTVIILKDVKCKELEALLDYMYLGEVNVRKDDLAPLLETAECLQLKGLVRIKTRPGDIQKRKLDTPISSSGRKKLKMQDNKHSSSPCHTTEKKCSSESSIALNNSTIYIKDEASSAYEIIEITKEEFSPYDLENDGPDNIKIEQPCLADSGNMFKLEPASDLWRDVISDTDTDPLSSLASNPEESFDVPTVSGQRNEKSVKQLPCTVCGKFFGKKCDLERHTRIHTGEKPFQCLYCMFRGRQKSHVLNHISSVHPDVPGSCNVNSSHITEIDQGHRQSDR